MTLYKVAGLRLGVQMHVGGSVPAINGKIPEACVDSLRAAGYTVVEHDGSIPAVDHHALEVANRNAERVVWKSESAEQAWKSAQAA